MKLSNTFPICINTVLFFHNKRVQGEVIHSTRVAVFDLWDRVPAPDGCQGTPLDFVHMYYIHGVLCPDNMLCFL